MITAILPFKLGDEHFQAEMQYDKSDPYGILFLFRQRCADEECTEIHETKWVLGRDLFNEGIDSETWVGEGDLRIRRNSHSTVEVLFSPDEGVANIVVPRNVLRNFLKRTANVVDYGKESEHIDWDAFDDERVTW